ncbi:MAG: preprotein translocase subunit SecY [Planctomycetota bacterium]|nr:MAG: preprotein translocase subunit SecY [Planctomycetota bacterium]
MFQAILNIFKIPDLRNKVLFTVGMLAVYRIGFWIPVPGVNQEALARTFEQAQTEQTGLGQIASFVSIFSGGSLGQSTIFGLGIMPYITAAIIFQVFGSVSERLKKLKEEGAAGQQKIQEYTRYLTILMCVIQAVGWLVMISKQGLIFSNWVQNPVWWVMAVTSMTAGSIFLMWLGEQIDRYGIGNGASLIITAGILASMPNAIQWVIQNSPIGQIGPIAAFYGVDVQSDPQMSWLGVIMLVASFLVVVGGAVLITVAQRRIPIQQAKHTRGRKVYGGQRSYLPLRVNHSGVMPIIFASSLMVFPSAGFSFLAEQAVSADLAPWWRATTRFLADNFQMGTAFPYILVYVGMIYFFSYLWTTVQFNPEDMAKQLRDSGSFIPGLRPGPRTAEYLETVLERITYVGAGFLAVIAVIPTLVASAMKVPFFVAAFLGGTGLLIVVSVGLDFIQRIEANLLMRNYAGFLGGSDQVGGGGPRVRSPRG